MSNKAKESIDTMLAAGVTPRDTKGGAVILKGQGVRYHQLISTTGEKTRLGKYFEDKSEQELPVGGFDPRQAPYRQGDTEYIRMRNGEEKAIRRYSPAENQLQFTALGKSFYSRVKRAYIIQIPVKV